MRKSTIFALTILGMHLLFSNVLIQAENNNTLDYKKITEEIKEENLKNYISYFSSLNSRVVGYPGCQKAADFIISEFQKIGLQDVRGEKFPVTVPVDKGASLKILDTLSVSEVGIEDTNIIELSCFYPNLVRTSTLPPEGLEGEILYGGNGELKNFNGKDIDGCIALLDFNSGKKWIDISMMGAKAVIFIEPQDTTRFEADEKFLALPLNIPRFWIKKDDATTLLKVLEEKSTRVKLQARMDWQAIEGANILGYLEGSDPQLKKEVIILSSYYDSMSVVPALSPGADNACGITALLEIARIMKNNPPARSVLFVATSGHFMRLSGITYFLDEHLRRTKPFIERMKEPFYKDSNLRVDGKLDVKLFIGLDLSSGSDELAVWHGSRAFYFQEYFSKFGMKLTEYRDEICKVLGYEPDNALINGISPIRGISWDTLIPSEIKVDGRMVLYAGTPSLTFATVYDFRKFIDTPLDTESRVNYKNLSKQIKFLACSLSRGLNDKDFFPQSRLKLDDKLMTLNAKIVTFDRRTSFVPSEPVPNALAYVVYNWMVNRKNFTGVRGLAIQLTDEKGMASINGIWEGKLSDNETTDLEFNTEPILQGYHINNETGEIDFAPDKGSDGDASYPMKFKITTKEQSHVSVVFPCKAVNVYDLIDPAYLVQLDGMDVFNDVNSYPISWGCQITGGGWIWSSDVEHEGVAFANPKEKIKVLGNAGPLGRRLLLLNSPSSSNAEEATGYGFPITGISAITMTPYQGAHDMLALNEYRINSFQRYGVENNRLSELHKEAKEALDQAKVAKERKLWDEHIKNARKALSIASRGYPDVKATANDVIKAIIFYMALLIPFAYFLERLLFDFSEINKQIIGVSCIFILIYWIMRQVHPAFRLAEAPEVILIGFILLALSVIVISFVFGKFQEQMGEMKRKRAMIYEADVGRIAASGTAFNLGVSNMKRRKLRTLLTAITLILLTFTVLSFTSVKTYIQYNKILKPNKPLYNGILIKNRGWNPLEEAAYGYIKGEFSDIAIVAPRSWLICKALDKNTRIKIRRGEEGIYTYGLLGMSPQEDSITHMSKYLLLGRWFKEGEKYSCILPEELAFSLWATNQEKEAAEAINKKDLPDTEKKTLVRQFRLDTMKKYFSADKGEVITIFGQEVNVIGVIDSSQVAGIRDLDDELITPVSFSSMTSDQLQEMQTARNQITGGHFEIQTADRHADVSSVPILPFDFLDSFGGTIESIALHFTPDIDVIKETEDFVSRLGLTIYVGDKDNTWVYSSIGSTSFSGMSNVVIPIIIAALIVLNTMLGSVYERVREIGTYSSVGLAPVHIGSLFIAEACVYAVLGAVMGYLLGQVVAWIFTKFGFMAGLTLNYSSTAAVLSTLVVMATVILSTIYPAKKAAQMAVPDVTRKWVLPDPKGDIWEFDFPFTIAGKEVLGIYLFFNNFFDSYTEASVGTFYTSGVSFSSFQHKNEEGYSIKMVVYLSPFDLGVSQEVDMRAVPTGEYGIYLIQLTIKRNTGEALTWTRLNRSFLNIIRKQFLIWRTIPIDVKKQYTDEGMKKLQIKDKA